MTFYFLAQAYLFSYLNIFEPTWVYSENNARIIWFFLFDKWIGSAEIFLKLCVGDK